MAEENVVNHPKHYELDKIECIDAMEMTQGKAAVMSFCICNAFKYLWRHQRKNGVEDVKKAQWYLNKYIELAEKDQDELKQEIDEIVDVPKKIKNLLFNNSIMKNTGMNAAKPDPVSNNGNVEERGSERAMDSAVHSSFRKEFE